MKNFLLPPILILFVLICSTSDASSQSRSVYFQRISDNSGAVSSIPVAGPGTAIKDLIKGLNVSFSGGLTSDGSGNFFYTDYLENTVSLADKAGKSTLVVSQAAGLNLPQAITYDASHKFLYIYDRGTQRIVRANLNAKFPVNAVEVVVAAGSSETVVITDLKYNPQDGLLYWSNAGQIFRSAVNNVTLPTQTFEQLTFNFAVSPLYIDFDTESPQNLYLADLGNKGIFKAPVTPLGVAAQNDSHIFLYSGADPEYLVFGIGVDKESSTLCYSSYENTSLFLICGDRNNFSAASQIFNSQITGAFSFLVIDESPTVVTPSTQPSAPVVNLDLSTPKPQVQLLLEAFTGAVLKNKGTRAKGGSSGKVSFQYAIEIKRPTDSNGTPLSKKEQDARKLTSKKNQLTVKNLKANSNYEVKYRVEILTKTPGDDAKVTKRTAYSPTINFIVP